jgi:hypothetical protein
MESNKLFLHAQQHFGRVGACRAWSRVGVVRFTRVSLPSRKQMRALQIVKQRVRAREQVPSADCKSLAWCSSPNSKTPQGVMRFHYLTPSTRAFSQTRANFSQSVSQSVYIRYQAFLSQLHTNQQLILGDIFVRTKVWRADERARIDLASVPPPAHSPPL